MALSKKMGDAMEIPLRNRKGEIVGYAIVDAEDYDAVMSAGRWSKAKNGGYAYRRKTVNRRPVEVKMHRFVLGMDASDPRQVDHEDGDTLNNRKSNLRPCGPSLNGQNRPCGWGRSGVRGVHWNEQHQKWRVQHTLNRKKVHLGLFDTLEEADAVARQWRKENMPFSEEARS